MFNERQEKNTKQVSSKDFVYKKAFYLLSRIPHDFKIYYKLVKSKLEQTKQTMKNKQKKNRRKLVK